MKISHGISNKKLTIYPHDNTSIDPNIMFGNHGDESDNVVIYHQVLTVNQYISLEYKNEDEKLGDFIVSSSSFYPHIFTHIMDSQI